MRSSKSNRARRAVAPRRPRRGRSRRPPIVKRPARHASPGAPGLGETWFKHSNRSSPTWATPFAAPRPRRHGRHSEQTRERQRWPGKGRGGAAQGALSPAAAAWPTAPLGPPPIAPLAAPCSARKHCLLPSGCGAFALVHVAAGLEQSYRKARRAFSPRPTQVESDEAFHSWRKATQAHWRHMQLLGRGWPESIGARAAEAKELSRLVGRGSRSLRAPRLCPKERRNRARGGRSRHLAGLLSQRSAPDPKRRQAAR